MYDKDKRSFFERLTGTMNTDAEEATHVSEETSPETEGEDESDYAEEREPKEHPRAIYNEPHSPAIERSDFDEYDREAAEEIPEDEPEGELAVDVYEDNENIYVQAMIAGVDPEDVDVQITREMVDLRGRRANMSSVSEENYFLQELYWGGFSRKIVLPEEVDPEQSEAIEKHGLLALKLPKLNKKRSQKIEVRSVD